MRFSILTPQSGRPFREIEEEWVEAEELGFYAGFVNDHLVSFPREGRSYLEAWTLLSALASVTEEIRLGTLVSCVLFRHPSVLAKMAATLDVLSGGRLILGLGAGWRRGEAEAYGIPFPEAGERIGRLREALDVVRLMWSDDSATYSGRYYTVEEAVCNPKPVQRPNPPILVGGSGERLLLRVTAEYADVANFDRRVRGFDGKLEVLRGHCREVGRDPSEIEVSLLAFCWPGRNPLKWVAGLAPVDVLIAGTATQCVRRIEAFSRRGVEHFILQFRSAGDVRFFGREVLPSFG